MLANSVVKVSAARIGGLEVTGSLKGQRRFVRRPQVRRASDKPGNILCENVQDLARGLASGDSLGVSREDGEIAIPARGQFAPLHQFDLGGEFGKPGSISGEEFQPLAAGLTAARANSG